MRRAHAALLTAAVVAGLVSLGWGPAEGHPTGGQTGDGQTGEQPGGVSFAGQVLPIFEARCVECHSGPDAEWGLVLTEYATVMAGSDYGPVVEPGSPEESLLIKLILSGDMPQEGEAVPAEELELLEGWIREGAADN